MIFSRDSGQHKPDETTNHIRARRANRANQFLFDTNDHPAYAIFNRQPRRLETSVTHTKQTTATLLNRQLSRGSALANLTRPVLPSDLTFDDRNPRA